jgi:ribosomal protein L37E
MHPSPFHALCRCCSDSASNVHLAPCGAPGFPQRAAMRIPNIRARAPIPPTSERRAMNPGISSIGRARWRRTRDTFPGSASSLSRCPSAVEGAASNGRCGSLQLTRWLASVTGSTWPVAQVLGGAAGGPLRSARWRSWPQALVVTLPTALGVAAWAGDDLRPMFFAYLAFGY